MTHCPDTGWFLAMSLGLDRQFQRVHHGRRMPQTTTMQYDSELHQWVVTTNIMPAIPENNINAYFRAIMAHA
tara:strand:+ start:5447 stop:5662 length:216 start_codon:yes stop_codon:yes gene_type:complete